MKFTLVILTMLANTEISGLSEQECYEQLYSYSDKLMKIYDQFNSDDAAFMLSCIPENKHSKIYKEYMNEDFRYRHQ
jgi:hypothetical protein